MRCAMWAPSTNGSAPGYCTDARLEDGARIVTFANGMTIRELIVDLDDDARRFVWAAVGDPLTHHNASMQVFEDGDGRSRLVWITDILPNSVTGDIQALVEKGADAIRQTLESQTAGQRDSQAFTHPGAE